MMDTANDQLVYIQTSAGEFTLRKENLFKSLYFKSMLNFTDTVHTSNNTFDYYTNKRLTLKINFDAKILRLILVHMKHGTVYKKLTLSELKSVEQLADYLIYEPLMENNIIKPKKLNAEFIIHYNHNACDWDINIKSRNMDYIKYCMEKYHPDTYYLFQLTDKIGNNFLKNTYGKIDNNVHGSTRIVTKYIKVSKIINNIQKNLNLSIKNILCIFNAGDKIYFNVKFIADEKLSFPCGIKFNKKTYTKYLSDKSVSKSPVTLLDFTLNNTPMAYTSY